MIESLYFLKLTSRYCTHEVRVNDLYCANNYKGNQSGSEIPINDLLRKGNNVVKLIIDPLDMEPQERDVVFMINAIVEERGRHNNSVKQELLNLKSEVLIEEAPAELLGKFVVAEPFEDPSYLKEPSIKLNDTIYKGVFDFYKNLQSLMIDKDIDAITKLFELKERNFAQAYGLDFKARMSYVSESLRGYLTEPQAEVLDVDMAFLKYELYANGKLICLEEKLNKKPALGVYSEINQNTTYFPIYLRATENSFEIAR